MENEWGLSKGEWRDSTPYGQKIQNYIETYTEWVVYLRKDARFKCPQHWDPSTETTKAFGTVDCSCWGLGVSVSGTIVPARTSRGADSNVGKMNDTDRDMPGYTDIYPLVVHFPKIVAPQIGDIILFCEWNTPIQKIHKVPKVRPTRIHSIYIIRLTDSHFQRELSYYSCGCDSIWIEYDKMSKLLINKTSNLPVIGLEQTVKSFW